MTLDDEIRLLRALYPYSDERSIKETTNIEEASRVFMSVFGFGYNTRRYTIGGPWLFLYNGDTRGMKYVYKRRDGRWLLVRPRNAQ